jgi:hypothetical protein
MKKKIAFIGSCLAARAILTLREQRSDISVVGSLSNVRTDALRDFIVSGTPLGAPRAVVIQFLNRLPEAARQTNRWKLLHQTTESISDTERFFKAADYLVIDNNYDLSAPLVKYRSIYRFCNIRDSTPIAKTLGLMRTEGAREIYQSFVDGVRRSNPSIQIVFFQFPISGFGAQGRSGLRRKRAYEFAEEMSLDGAYVIPMVDIPADDLSSDSAHHFSKSVYDVYAAWLDGFLEGRAPALPKPDPVTKEIQLSDFSAAVGIKASATAAEKKFWPPSAPRATAYIVKPRSRGENPYAGLPDRNYWKPAVGDRFPLAIDGLYDRKFSISKNDRITASGSCFAQHIGRHLKANGFAFVDVEPPPPELAQKNWAQNGYGIYSARYGNIYTSTQLLQLFQRAFGEISLDEIWETGGCYYDAFRPNLQPGGYASVEALRADRDQHLAAVRRLFEQTDVLIFTMGLTECWRNRRTSAVYPICPGVTVGQFDPDIHEFRNLTFAEILSDMEAVLERLKSIRPSARVLLTVSPVPLTATAEERHVLVSTIHSKSVLRAVAGELAARHTHVDYFPSYEIVTGSPFRAMFFESNMRTVHDEGVNFVMKHFFAQHAPGSDEKPRIAQDSEEFCDEILLEIEREIESEETAN